MSIEILPALAAQLENANRIIETLVFRTAHNMVFTIEIGESMLPESPSKYGAKVTRIASPPQHLGVCHADSIELVSGLAQERILQTLEHDTSRTDTTLPVTRFTQSKRSA